MQKTLDFIKEKIGDFVPEVKEIQGDVKLGKFTGVGTNSVIMPGNNIPEGVRLSKQYYYRGQVIHKEHLFDSRIIYKFEFNHGDKEQKCPNCGSVGTLEEFNNGCPYCGANFTIDHSNNKSYGRTLKELFSFW